MLSHGDKFNVKLDSVSNSVPSPLALVFYITRCFKK